MEMSLENILGTFFATASQLSQWQEDEKEENLGCLKIYSRDFFSEAVRTTSAGRGRRVPLPAMDMAGEEDMR